MAVLEFQRATIEVRERRDNYAQFAIEPLERGFGITLGNSLRRILLSSLPGAAVTYVKIDGVLHEFSTIPGVVEDTTNIILNLKGLPLKLNSDEPKVLRIEATGEREVTASDIVPDADIELHEPDYHIATLSDKKARLFMEIGVEKVARLRHRGQAAQRGARHRPYPGGLDLHADPQSRVSDRRHTRRPSHRLRPLAHRDRDQRQLSRPTRR